MRETAFTLVELLVVVSLIAILTAVAVPNFLEAQTRSKLTRAQADMRTILVGLASYSIDHNKLPFNEAVTPVLGQEPLLHLTSPIAYISTVPHDVFWRADTADINDPALPYYAYIHMQQLHDLGLADIDEIWEELYYVVSRGPDGTFEANNIINGELLSDEAIYDPRNGTISQGDFYLSLQGNSGGHVLQDNNRADGEQDDEL